MSGTPSAPELLQAAKEGDNRACEQVLQENAGLLWSIVRRYYGRGVDPDDLYQLACLGFLKAVRGYDVDFGTRFSTYAVPKIAGEIRRFLRDDGAVKVRSLSYVYSLAYTRDLTAEACDAARLEIFFKDEAENAVLGLYVEPITLFGINVHLA